MITQQEFRFDRERLYHVGRENNLFYLGDEDEGHKFVTFDIPPREITATSVVPPPISTTI